MTEQENVAWAIYRLSEKGHYLGQVNASDEDKAIKIAIQEFKITDIYDQARLVARMISGLDHS